MKQALVRNNLQMKQNQNTELNEDEVQRDSIIEAEELSQGLEIIVVEGGGEESKVTVNEEEP